MLAFGERYQRIHEETPLTEENSRVLSPQRCMIQQTEKKQQSQSNGHRGVFPPFPMFSWSTRYTFMPLSASYPMGSRPHVPAAQLPPFAIFMELMASNAIVYLFSSRFAAFSASFSRFSSFLTFFSFASLNMASRLSRTSC